MEAVCGKVALITGTTYGIGAAYVKDLFQNGLKACTMSDIDPKGQELADEMNCKYGEGKALFIQADAIQKDALECVFEKNMQTFKGLDIVVNNAGILRDSLWEQTIDLNIKSTIHGSLLGIKYMGKNNGGNGGTVVNTSSILGMQPCFGCPVYTGTKHFVIGFDRSMGSPFFFNLTGVKFLTICPGVTETPMVWDADKWTLQGFPGLGQELAALLQSMPTQTTQPIAEGLRKMLNEGENGSVWVGEDNMFYEVEIPDRKTFKKKIC
ncbi:15-hydroxyprostaglandin dehydrogenase [NAD(+)]-like isoform X1 [Cylas formicarius]|uniref:15-hydroxyprostaglandin dehydrogenase [NAD(+)]-like isoform X1 n=1 Tax=Cylas formicarius TaxID=197179 RepID=UPI002958D09C|nr:15-hydroxyprostaglandin dehydrogenase [NAD(+)]-like isoform X1 [Cylas formicarius]